MTNQVIGWWATNRSSQATAAYATRKLTTVATTVAVSGMSPVTALGSSKRPAAVRAGIDRKNDIRVAATRSRPANSPAEMVAADLETPGISEKHWITPMKIASRIVSSRSWRAWVATRSANTMTTLHRI